MTMKLRGFSSRRAERIALLVLSLAGVAQAESAARESPRVSANIGPLRNGNGSVGCRIYTSPEGFPRTAKGTRSERVKLAGTSARCVFSGLKPGTYAITVHHDENDNRKFDTNFLGIPLEGYGVSNNRTYATHAPRWEESKFVVEPGKDLELGIQVRY